MKRGFTGLKSSRSVDVPEGEQGFWPSFADMMSSFALIMLFLMLISYLQNLITSNRLIATEYELEEKNVALEEKSTALEEKTVALDMTEDELKQKTDWLTQIQQSLEATEKTLAEMTEESAQKSALLAEQEEQLAAQASSLSEQEEQLAAQQTTLSEQEARLSTQAETLASQETTIAEQKQYLAMTTEELTKLREQMKNIAFLRINIMTKIKENIEASLGSGSTVSIGESGNLILSDGVLFDNNKYDIKPESYDMLNRLTTAFYSFLSEEDNRIYVESIVISGHTDSTGSAETNRNLSANRANAVLTYLLEKNSGILSEYESYFCAAGYGETRPVASNDTASGRAQNRRIEISIILKDESVLEIVEAYLGTEMPQ